MMNHWKDLDVTEVKSKTLEFLFKKKKENAFIYCAVIK